MKGYSVLRPFNEVILKIWFPEQRRLLATCTIEREKFCPGPGLELGPLVLRTSALTTEPPILATYYL